jgi:uncharacterized protein YjiK
MTKHNSNKSAQGANVKFLLFIITAVISIILLITSFSKKEALELEASYKIKVKEPSGLGINDAGTVLYTVSDKTSKVYKLSTTGDVIQTLDCEAANLEGVSSYTSNKLLLAEEGSKTIVVFDMVTGEESNHKIKYKNKDKNSGIEGVTYDNNSETIFILNEKNPGKLIRLRNDFSVMAKYDLDFASDYSGIFYDNSSNKLWILSDQYKTVNKCTLKGELIESFTIDVKQPEGIAIANKYIYIVSDSEAKLYVYKKP